MNFEKKDLKGQGALEYLLMIGLGVSVSAVVILFGFSIAGQQQCANAISQWDSMCGMIALEGTCNTRNISGESATDCEWVTNCPEGRPNGCYRITDGGAPDWAGVPKECRPPETT